MKSGFLLDVVVAQCATIFQLLTSKDETLLVWWDSFFVLDLCLDVVDGITGLNLKSDGLASQGFDEDLHTSTESQDKMKRGFFLDVVVTQCATIFQLLSSEDETLLIRRDSFLVLDLGLHVIDGITGLNLEGDGLACQGFDEDLHTSSESQDKMKSGFLLDVVVAQCATIFQLLTSKDETLLVWWDSFFVLDLCLDVVDGITGLNLKSDGLASQGFDEDLHTSTESQDKMKC